MQAMTSNFTLAKVEMDCQGTGRAIRASRGSENLRIVGTHLHDARIGNSGAFGEFSNSTNLDILGNYIERKSKQGMNNEN